jgi:hypothetical protein
MAAILCKKHGGGVASFTSPNVRDASMDQSLSKQDLIQIALHLHMEKKAFIYVDRDFYERYVKSHIEKDSLLVIGPEEAESIFDRLAPCCSKCLANYVEFNASTEVAPEKRTP